MRDPSALTEDDINEMVHSVEQPAPQATAAAAARALAGNPDNEEPA
jgi:ribosomal protein L12E/L44/L45/RPP1/RPP2